MRKFTLSVISVLLALTVTLAGCSCNAKSELSFKSAYLGENVIVEPSSGYRETLTYKVAYADSYLSEFAISERLKKNIDEGKYGFTFGDGVYTAVLETVSAASLTGEAAESDLIDNLPSEAKTLYKLTTDLTLPVTYANCSYDGNTDDYAFTDNIKSTVYFCSYKFSFAPIYVNTFSHYTTFSAGEDTAVIGRVRTERTVVYNQKSYKTTLRYYDGIKEENPELKSENGYTNDYEYRTLIDNAELLFAVRNLDVELEKSVYIPVVSAQYKEDKTLAIKAESASTEPKTTIKVNGTLSEEELQVINYSLSIYGTENAGTRQLFSVQKAKGAALENKALLVKYVEPLTAYGLMAPMGVLVYTLTSAEYVTA